MVGGLDVTGVSDSLRARRPPTCPPLPHQEALVQWVHDEKTRRWPGWAWEESLPRSAHPVPAGHAPHPPMYLLARRETRFFHSNTCRSSSKSVKRPEGLPISSKPAAREGGCAHLPVSTRPALREALSGQPGGQKGQAKGRGWGQ